MVSFITDTQMAEGFVAPAIWAACWFYVKKYIQYPQYIEAALAWSLLWIIRKLGISLYKSKKLGNNWASWRIEFDPFPTLIIDKSYQ